MCGDVSIEKMLANKRGFPLFRLLCSVLIYDTIFHSASATQLRFHTNKIQINCRSAFFLLSASAVIKTLSSIIIQLNNDKSFFRSTIHFRYTNFYDNCCRILVRKILNRHCDWITYYSRPFLIKSHCHRHLSICAMPNPDCHRSIGIQCEFNKFFKNHRKSFAIHPQ